MANVDGEAHKSGCISKSESRSKRREHLKPHEERSADFRRLNDRLSAFRLVCGPQRAIRPSARALGGRVGRWFLELPSALAISHAYSGALLIRKQIKHTANYCFET